MGANFQGCPAKESRAKAKTAPGIAYPIPAMKVRLEIHFFWPHLFAIVRNKAAITANKALYFFNSHP